MNSKVSIILPVYNGEKYLTETLNSISTQSMTDFEVICVDDGSVDNSPIILNEFAAKDTRFKVFTKKNEGTAVKSIMYALPHAGGEYFFYCSQDDLLSEDCLEKMYKRALETNADAVLPDMIWYCEAADNSQGIFPPNKNYDLELTGQEAFILSLDWKIHGFSLRKMDLVKKLGYDDLYTNSDEYMTRFFYLNSKKVVFSKGMFYYRQDNENSISKKISPKIFDWLLTDIRLLNLMVNNDIHKIHIKTSLKAAVKSFKKHRKIFKEHKNTFSVDEKIKIKKIILETRKNLMNFVIKYKMFNQFLRLIKYGYL